MSCKYCNGEVGSHIKIDKHPAAVEKNLYCPKEGQIYQLHNDTPGVILWSETGIPIGVIDIKYCPICGSKLRTKEESDVL